MGKHLNLSQRIIIESNLNENNSLRKTGEIIGKLHTTISREILSRRILIKRNRFNNFNVKCDKTQKAPFVCNGCPNKNKCRKNRYFYYYDNHINNTKREKLNGDTPYNLMKENIKKLGFYFILQKILYLNLVYSIKIIINNEAYLLLLNG